MKFSKRIFLVALMGLLSMPIFARGFSPAKASQNPDVVSVQEANVPSILMDDAEEDKTAPTIDVKINGITAVGEKIGFKVTLSDDVSAEDKIVLKSSTLYYCPEGGQQEEVALDEDGKFKATKKGEYSFVVTAADEANNEKTQAFKFEVKTYAELGLADPNAFGPRQLSYILIGVAGVAVLAYAGVTIFMMMKKKKAQ